MFCDFMQVYQDHGQSGNWATVCDQLTYRVDSADGAVLHKGATPLKIEGSYATAFLVRCHGGVVSFSGNIGRFGRSDNVVNFSVDDTKKLINIFLSAMGLPVFTGGQVTSSAPVISDGQQDDSRRIESIYNGARVTRVDLTENFATGSRVDALEFMRLMSMTNYGRMKVGVYGNGETVTIGEGSRYLYQKIYLKADEMRQRQKKTEVSDDYIQHAYDSGLVRYEIEFKQACDRVGIRPWDNCTDKKIKPIYKQYREKAIKTMKTIDDKGEALPLPVLKTYCMFREGTDPRLHMSRATWYKHKKIIEDVKGIDISNPRASSEEPTRIIELEKYEPPQHHKPDFEFVAAQLLKAAESVRVAV